MLYLVTGATGFVGFHVVQRLIHDGQSVRILRRQNSSTQDLADLSFETVIGDICDSAALIRAVAGVDVIIHCAAKISYWPLEAAETWRINVQGTECVLRAAATQKLQRFVYVSSVMALGVPPVGTLGTEDNRQFRKLTDPYSTSKVAAELAVKAAAAQGLPAVIVNPGAIIGPVDRRRAVGGLLTPSGLGRYFYIDGGMATVDVGDVVTGILQAVVLGRNGENYLLTGENCTYRQMRAMIADIWKIPQAKIRIPNGVLKCAAFFSDLISYVTRRPPTVPLPMAQFLPYSLFFSSLKAQRELAVTFRPFHQAAERAIAWCRSQN